MEPYEMLEKELSEWIGVPEVVVCSSGTSALHLALESLRLPQGSEVLIPDFTMIAVPRAVTLAGLTPVLIDCDDSLNLDTEIFPNTRKTVANIKAMIAVHTYGRRCDMGEIHRWASTWQVPVIEDMAELHGIAPHLETDLACWSFYKNKIIGGEEGGALTSPNDLSLGRFAMILRSLGFTAEHDFTHVPRGHNYRLANCLAEKIRESLREAPLRFARRRRTEERLDRAFEGSGLARSVARRLPVDSPWVYDIRIPGMSALRQGEIVAKLKDRGIPARHAFKPVSMQAEYRSCKVIGNGKASIAAREVFYVPLTLTDEEIDTTVAVLKDHV